VFDKKEKLMEILGALEEKIKCLVALVKDLQAQNDRLVVDNISLKEQVVQFELVLSKNKDDLKEWSTEKAFTKKVIDDLIINIDSLIESQSR
jgi:regulator of replication initiation timing